MVTTVQASTSHSFPKGEKSETKAKEKRTLKRRHDLDALRATAMLLGIVLHAALSFAPIPWTVSDTQQSEAYVVLFAAIHGFRMPLFFLVSGFFTAMLWRKRGLGGFIKQRVKRIVVPLLVGCLTLIPAMWGVSMFVTQTSPDTEEVDWFDTAATGDFELLRNAIESGEIDVNAKQPSSGASLVTIATFCGQTETVEMLLEQGAEVNQENGDSGTALHVAVFMGRVEEAKRLLQAGADPSAKDNNGMTPKDNLKVDFGTTNFIAQMYGQSLEQEQLKFNRAEIAKVLGADVKNAGDSVSAVPGLDALYGLLFQFPVFMHLWFLAFLCWLVVGFAGYTFLVKSVSWDRIPKWLFCSSASLVWLVPLTMIPQQFMMPEMFGPDSSVGLLPIPSVLGYYAIFFFFGAIYWDVSDEDDLLGRRWYITLPVCLGVVFPVGLEFVTGSFGLIPPESFISIRPVLGNLFQALFVWLMLFGSIGMFRSLFSTENRTIRYISDSSYWLYLAHLPLVILVQWYVKDLSTPSIVKFIGINVLVAGVLLITYEYLVRYTIIGSVLNGPKKRNEPLTRDS